MQSQSDASRVHVDYEMIRAIVRGTVEAVLAERRPRRGAAAAAKPPPGPPVALAGLEVALVGVARHSDPAGRSYVVMGDALSALGIPAPEHQRHMMALAAELACLGWERGGRLRPAGVGGPRVVAWYPPLPA